jgi:uncharacterized protein YdcH (DUF465 family)
MVGRHGIGPHLAALIDERDQLRIKIKSIEEGQNPDEIVRLRRMLVALDREILQGWETPDG